MGALVFTTVPGCLSTLRQIPPQFAFGPWPRVRLGRGYSCPLEPQQGVNVCKQGGNRRLCYCSPCLSSAGGTAVTVFVGHSEMNLPHCYSLFLNPAASFTPTSNSAESVTLLSTLAFILKRAKQKHAPAVCCSAGAVCLPPAGVICTQPRCLRSHVAGSIDSMPATLRAGEQPGSAMLHRVTSRATATAGKYCVFKSKFK